MNILRLRDRVQHIRFSGIYNDAVPKPMPQPSLASEVFATTRFCGCW
jgi:hypothetical protein